MQRRPFQFQLYQYNQLLQWLLWAIQDLSSINKTTVKKILLTTVLYIHPSIHPFMLSSFNSFLLSSIQLFPPFFRPPFRAFIHPPHAPHPCILSPSLFPSNLSILLFLLSSHPPSPSLSAFLPRILSSFLGPLSSQPFFLLPSHQHYPRLEPINQTAQINFYSYLLYCLGS